MNTHTLHHLSTYHILALYYLFVYIPLYNSITFAIRNRY